VAHSLWTEDHWPSTDFFHLVSICVSESGCEGEGEEDGEGMKLRVYQIPGESDL
jgi:hypothetical protein